MTSDSRSPHEIERDIEQDRAHLTQNLEALQDRFSLDGVMRSVGDQLRDHGSDIGASITRTVKENPAAVALTGIGLAWMIFGGKSDRGQTEGYTRPYTAADPGYGPRNHGSNGYTDRYRAVPRPDPRMKGGEAGVPDWAQIEDDEDHDSYADRISDTVSGAGAELSNAASTAQHKAQQAGSAASSKVADARDAASSAASRAAGGVKSTAQSAQDRAARLRDRLAKGTENLSEEARARVVAAREAAVEARHKAVATASARARQAADFYDSQPLVAGALAVAIGAAIGGALPRTRKEDEWMGEHSDTLMREAERIFEEEREKAAAVASAAVNEAKTVAKEKRDEMNKAAPGDKTAAEAAADEAKSAGKRVADAAQKEADDKDLGKVSS